jgi:hypothetical protein
MKIKDLFVRDVFIYQKRGENTGSLFVKLSPWIDDSGEHPDEIPAKKIIIDAKNHRMRYLTLRTFWFKSSTKIIPIKP